MDLIKQVIGYSISTLHLSLKFKFSKVNFLHGFTDSSLVKLGDGKSSVGGCFFVNDSSGTFHAYSTKVAVSSLVSTSSCEAELGLYECCLKGLYFREILLECGYLTSTTPCIIFTDNASVIAILKKGSTNSNIRLLSNRIIFIQDFISRGMVKVVHINGEYNVSDILTKGTLPRKRFDLLSNVLLEGYTSFPDLNNFVKSLLL